jgi:hypothetical protein
VLEELLTSHGHELYTCFFAMPGAGLRLPRTTALARPAARRDGGAARARVPAAARRFLVPVGLLHEETDASGFTTRKVALGNDGDVALGERRWTGFVAVAPNFGVVRDFSEDLRAAQTCRAMARSRRRSTPRSWRGPGRRRRAARSSCSWSSCRCGGSWCAGFEPATVGLLEALVLAEPLAEVLVMVDDEAALGPRASASASTATSTEYRMLTLSPGSFVAQEDGSFVYQPRLREALRCGRSAWPSGDRSALLQLVDLPHGFGHVGDLDLALLLATGREDGDARTTQALLALEVARTRNGRRSPLRVIAEVVDAELCARLRRRARLYGDDRVQIYALERLRAAFLFQSVLIPAFNLVYGELLGPWGQSFARKEVCTPGAGQLQLPGAGDPLRRPPASCSSASSAAATTARSSSTSRAATATAAAST